MKKIETYELVIIIVGVIFIASDFPILWKAGFYSKEVGMFFGGMIFASTINTILKIFFTKA